MDGSLSRSAGHAVFCRVFHAKPGEAIDLFENPSKTLTMLIRQRDKVNKMQEPVPGIRGYPVRPRRADAYFFFLITMVFAFVVKEPTTPSVT